MRVIISAGGTGGHIYPALAILNKIKESEPDSEFLYIGTHNRMEKDIIPSYNIPYESITVHGFDKHLLNNFKVIDCLIKANKKVKKIIKDFNPDIVIGAGGYVTVPVIRMAKKLGYKTFIHEQNSVPGKANLYLSRYADIIGVSFASSKKYFDKKKVLICGNPCSDEAIKTEAIDKKEFNLTNKPLILFVMGSLGSSKVNDFLIKTMSLFNNKNYEILFVTGSSDYSRIKQINFPSNVKVVPYVEKLVRVMKKADIMVTRAGASTLSEIIALQVPSIIIPSPYVTNNHQYKNALDLVNNNAAILLEEKDLSGDVIVRSIDKMLMDIKLIDEMKSNLAKMQIKDSPSIIYKSIVNLVRK